ncbi:FecCD family ABC transporter permease [Curvivirga aplysinae]|uniref:FecCD family ABC transporter permease n=1 Tax=Curvivirga aplysinae TaxID=2529852 RepID=UPI001C3F5A15|nr:iron ABC transporter permease [Curvivirga aplysinae]
MVIRRFPFALVCVAAGLVLAVAMPYGIATGSTAITFETVIAAFLGPDLATSFGLEPANKPMTKIILDLRLPRMILAALVGGGLAVVGGLLQTATRNDLADPFLFGLSSGAAAGAVFVITVTGDFLGIWTLPIAAFLGGLLSASVVLILVTRTIHTGPERLILAGLAVSFLFTAITNYLVFAGDQRAAHSVVFWSLGGLGLARWETIGFAIASFSLLMSFFAFRRRPLDALLAGDDTAHSLGADPKEIRVEIFVVCAISTGLFVALVGVIGFVGLMIPHLARAVVGPLHGAMLIVCALFGAALVVLSDIVSRLLLAPQELPIGVVTAALGAIFVIFLVTKRRVH